jgi:hypothetical protein
MRPWWIPWGRLVFWIGRHTTLFVRPLLRLATISLGRWTILRWHRRRWLLFETNFNGMWQPYIEDLARTMRIQWRSIWGGAYDFPGPLPSERLLHWIERADLGAQHYYCAYRDATTKTIVSALEFEPAFRLFAAQARHLEPAAFHVAWRRFIADQQAHL